MLLATGTLKTQTNRQRKTALFFLANDA